MKINLPAALAAIAVCSAPVARAQDAPKDTKDKVSYSIGLDIGRNLSKQGVEVNIDQLLGGVKDGIAGTKPKMTDEEMQSTMQALMGDIQKKQEEKQAKAAAENKEKGDKFLAENKDKKGWKTTASGLQYFVEAEGKGDKPKADDTVSVHYTGTLIDGKKFDSSRDRGEPVEFPVGGVIPGWTEALQLMSPGAKYKLAIPANLAYGEQAPPDIGPNSVLLFDVELLSVKKGEPAPAEGGLATPAPAEGGDANKEAK